MNKLSLLVFIFVIGIAVFFLQPYSSLSTFQLKVIGNIIGVSFLLNAIYGLLFSKVYGRSNSKYMGGMVEKAIEPGYYWGWVGLSFFAAFILIFTCTSLL
jgi:hypothetical protein